MELFNNTGGGNDILSGTELYLQSNSRKLNGRVDHQWQGNINHLAIRERMLNIDLSN